MGDGPAAIDDLSYLRFRMRSVRTGVWLTWAICAMSGIYFALTWDRPHRPLMAGIGVASALLASGLLLAPVERVVRGRWRELFFVGWSVLTLAAIGGAVVADGGGRSPAALVFFLPMIFAALSYPLASTVAVGALDVFVYLGASSLGGDVDPVYEFMVAACLACTACMCAWQARHHDQQREELTRTSRTDPLTGCLNRRGFEERLDAELRYDARSGRQAALITADLDEFKRVNDEQGHAAGDELLCWAVNRMGELVRPNDAIGRTGGDEFALLISGADRVRAEEVAGRVREALSARAPTSTGVACFPLDGVDRESLVRRADAALYEHKHRRVAHRNGDARALSWAAAMAEAVDARMVVRHRHAPAVADHAAAIALELGWGPGAVGSLRMAAMLHDVGKVAVPDEILRKPGPLTTAELAEVRRHPEAGAVIIGRIEGLETVAEWVRHSHEHFDGSGYPDGLAGEAIPHASRVLLVADAFDAMTSVRPYRSAMTEPEALEELRRHAGTQFDACCVEALVATRAAGVAARAE